MTMSVSSQAQDDHPDSEQQQKTKKPLSSWSFRSMWNKSSTTVSSNNDDNNETSSPSKDTLQENSSSKEVQEPPPSTSDESNSTSSKWSFRQLWSSSSQGKQQPSGEEPTSPQRTRHKNLIEFDMEEDVTTYVAGTISITVRQSSITESETKFVWKLDLEKDATSQQVTVKDISSDSSLLTLAETTGHAFLRPGDVLQSVNYCECRDLELGDIHTLLDARGGGLVTLIATRPDGEASLFQATAFTFHATLNSNVQGEEDDLTVGLKFTPSSSRQPGMEISETTMDGFFLASVLSPKDHLVSINGMDCREVEDDEVDVLLNSKFWGADHLSLLVLRPSAAAKWSLRRAAVAAAGGSMVSVGAVVMATPLHPLGHALAIGGVGVLGTEFEGPRRAMDSARQSLQNLSHSNSKADIPTETDTPAQQQEVETRKEVSLENEGVTGESNDSSESQEPKQERQDDGKQASNDDDGDSNNDDAVVVEDAGVESEEKKSINYAKQETSSSMEEVMLDEDLDEDQAGQEEPGVDRHSWKEQFP